MESASLAMPVDFFPFQLVVRPPPLSSLSPGGCSSISSASVPWPQGVCFSWLVGVSALVIPTLHSHLVFIQLYCIIPVYHLPSPPNPHLPSLSLSSPGSIYAIMSFYLFFLVTCNHSLERAQLTSLSLLMAQSCSLSAQPFLIPVIIHSIIEELLKMCPVSLPWPPSKKASTF